MARSSINFNVPNGADPMGIGGFDLGRSSYDPIQSIKEGWSTLRQDELIKEEGRRREYEQFMKNLPPAYESVNGKISGELNQKLVDMGRLAYQRYKSGVFSPWARTESGAKTEAELSQDENYIAKIGPVANKLDSMYKAAYDVRNNPDNLDKIDVELTDRNMKEFANAQNIDEMTRAATKPLIVFKPTVVEMNDWFAKQMNIDPLKPDVNQTNLVPDGKTGYYKTITTKEVDPVKLRKKVISVYTNADDVHKREIDRLFKIAPDEEKYMRDNNGNVILGNDNKPVISNDVKEWWANTRTPQTEKEVTKDFRKIDDENGKNKTFSWGNGWYDEKGELNIANIKKSNIPMAVKEGDGLVNKDFNSVASIPIETAFKEPFLNMNSANSINTATGEKAEQNTAGDYTPFSVEIIPVANRDETYILPNRKAVVVRQGQRLSKDDLEMINTAKSTRGNKNPNSIVTFEPFVLTASNYKTRQVAPNPNSYVQNTKTATGTQETIITPYAEVIDKMRPHAKKNGVDLEELDKYVKKLTEYYNGSQKKNGNLDADLDLVIDKYF